MTNNRDLFNYTANLILRAKPNFEYAREPLLRRMPNGDLVCVCLSGGKTEPANQNLVIISRSKDDGCTWSAPEIIFNIVNVPCGQQNCFAMTIQCASFDDVLCSVKI